MHICLYLSSASTFHKGNNFVLFYGIFFFLRSISYPAIFSEEERYCRHSVSIFFFFPLVSYLHLFNKLVLWNLTFVSNPSEASSHNSLLEEHQRIPVFSQGGICHPSILNQKLFLQISQRRLALSVLQKSFSTLSGSFALLALKQVGQKWT